MGYSEMLNVIIQESGLSLRKIASQCIDKGYNITPSYISQLKNGKLAPPSEEISQVLAEVCEYSAPTKLVFQGYLEKAPEIIKKYILFSSDINKTILKDMSLNKDFTSSEAYKEYIDNLDALSSLDLSTEYLNSDGDIADVLHEEINSITGGVYSKNQENTESNDTAYFFLRDRSMEPIININAHVQTTYTRKELIKNKDIIAFYDLDKKKPILRKVFHVQDKIILVPENTEFPVFAYDSMEDIDYIGKISSYKMNF